MFLIFLARLSKSTKSTLPTATLLKLAEIRAVLCFTLSLRWSKPKPMRDSFPGKKPYVSSLLQKKTNRSVDLMASLSPLCLCFL